MVSSARPLGLSPELRAALFHFTVFGSTGVGSAYLAIWLSGKGISPAEIGVINALPVLILLVANVFIGRLADRANDWRSTIVVLAWASGVASLALFFVEGFWGYLIVYALAAMPAGALVPILDAATLRMTERRGTDFGFVRAWGTVGYTMTAGLSGVVIGWLGAIAFVPLFAGTSMLRAILALPLPQFRAPPPASMPVQRPIAPKLSSLLRPWFVLPCIAFALIQATHYFLGAMGGLVWKTDGVPEGAVGALIAVAAAAEAAMMFAWRRVGKVFPARRLIIIAGLVAMARWLAMAFNPPLAVLVGLQLLHGITYPFSYFGILHFIANWAEEDIAAEAQAFSAALAQGAAVVTLLLFGWLIGIIGGQAYFVAAAMALAGAGAAWWSTVLVPANSRAERLAAASAG